MKPLNRERSMAKGDAYKDAKGKTKDELLVILKDAVAHLGEASFLSLEAEKAYWKEYYYTLQAIIRRTS